MFWILVLNKGDGVDTEGYIVYGMVFGFIALWLLFSLAKKLGGSEKFPRPKEGADEDRE